MSQGLINELLYLYSCLFLVFKNILTFYNNILRFLKVKHIQFLNKYHAFSWINS